MPGVSQTQTAKAGRCRLLKHRHRRVRPGVRAGLRTSLEGVLCSARGKSPVEYQGRLEVGKVMRRSKVGSSKLNKAGSASMSLGLWAVD